MKGSNEHGNETPRSMKGWDILESLSEWRIIKNG
jgi:hypothetical protein